MDPRGLRVTHTRYFSLLTHAKQFSLVTFCDTTAEIRNSEVGLFDAVTLPLPYGQTDLKVEIVL